MATTMSGSDVPATKGRVMRKSARVYDLLVSLLTFGREKILRERVVNLARLEPGESVLDVGCGTGSLALAARQRVGAAGVVHAIDASPEMIDRARRKAMKAGLSVDFRNEVAEALPHADERFDVVLSSMMLHHLPRAVREQTVREIERVLKPGGRLLAVDFGAPAAHRHGILRHLHRRGHVALPNLLNLLGETGFTVVDSGPVGMLDLYFVLAITAPT